MVDARREARLVEEHLDELLLVREVRVQPLDRDEALKPADAEDAGQEHGRHAARRDLGDQLVPVEPLMPSAIKKFYCRQLSTVPLRNVPRRRCLRHHEPRRPA